VGISGVDADLGLDFFNEREETAVMPDASPGGVDNSLSSTFGVALGWISSGSARAVVCVEAVGEM